MESGVGGEWIKMELEVIDYESLPTTSTTVQMAGGAVAGVLEHCIVYPLDSVKTRMQSLSPAPAARYRGVSDALWRMVRHEGALRPVRGMSAVVAGAGPAHALYFASYENLRDRLQQARVLPHSLAPGAAGVVATLIHDAIMTPADVVKQRMQMYNSPFRSCVECARSVYRQDGLRAFYRAYGTQLTMNVPFQSIHFVLYEWAQRVTNPQRQYWPAAHMLSGALAGAGAAAITTPLDVCKTLLNTQEASVLGQGTQTVNGLAAAVRIVYSHGGLPGFFRGLRARVVYQMPSTAICWTVYESMKYGLTRMGAADLVEEESAPPAAASTPASSPAPAASAVASYPTVTFSNRAHAAAAPPSDFVTPRSL
ncbi:mitoferrin-1-like isoform X2 [Amphibalanus amphitrite]|uniref:mitoferrin-1-like isoform X2 n=1 Tax=Amphibalanus amphitrite TaxID=1232801 RepID=UPI001C8FFAEE|nr:mitoferrin-1-like isoform X2 [Amphibalanus amphitrite]